MFKTNERPDRSGTGPYVEHDENKEIPLSLHGIIRHSTGKPAENIRVQVDMGAEGERIISLDEITDREGRFGFKSEKVMHPPDQRRRSEPLWTQVERDEGPQFYEWDMGWDDRFP